MKLELITLLGPKADQQVYQATIPTTEGDITVYPDHEALITIVKPGVISVKYKQDDSHIEFFAISGGVAEISGDRIRILVDEADHGDDIVEAESQAALDRALKLRDEAADQIELEKARQMIDRHAVRLKVAELRRRHRS